MAIVSPGTPITRLMKSSARRRHRRLEHRDISGLRTAEMVGNLVYQYHVADLQASVPSTPMECSTGE